MTLQEISLAPLRKKTVAVLGYGNQGRAHALNLRDSGIPTLVGARNGGGADKAKEDGFSVLSFAEAAAAADLVMFLLPDQVIPGVYGAVAAAPGLKGKLVGFAHGFAYHFGFIEKVKGCDYFLAGPKGAGAILRANFEKGSGLPGVFALSEGAGEASRALCLAYAKAIGIASSVLLETSFQEETECDLFGEQAVLCGGILQLMENAFEILVENGHTREMAFFECCFEARTILELWMKYGPKGISEKISPTAFYGGLTRGKRLVTPAVRKEMENIFQEVRSGKFAKEWMKEVDAGTPLLAAERNRLAKASLEAAYQGLRAALARSGQL